jgi:hypothetical protein
MWRDPLDELIEDLERALPSTPGRYEMLPRLEDLQRMVSVALYGTNEDRARAEKEKIKNRHWSNRAAALPAGVVRTTSGRGARAAGSASADGGTTELVGAPHWRYRLLWSCLGFGRG